VGVVDSTYNHSRVVEIFERKASDFTHELGELLPRDKRLLTATHLQVAALGLGVGNGGLARYY
jgi:hypothetical protein